MTLPEREQRARDLAGAAGEVEHLARPSAEGLAQQRLEGGELGVRLDGVADLAVEGGGPPGPVGPDFFLEGVLAPGVATLVGRLLSDIGIGHMELKGDDVAAQAGISCVSPRLRLWAEPCTTM